MGHLAEVVRKDVEFLKKGVSRGVEWANEALHIPRVSKTLDDLLWLRNLEEPHAPPLEPRSWPQPCYPGFASLLSLSLSHTHSNTQYGYLCVCVMYTYWFSWY